MKYYLAFKKKEILYGTRMNLKDIMLNEISQSQKEILYDSISMKYLK